MNLEKLRDTEYQKCTGLLNKLIGLDAGTEEKIYRYFALQLASFRKFAKCQMECLLMSKAQTRGTVYVRLT